MGYCPLVEFAEIEQIPTKFSVGTLVAMIKDIVPGISIRLNSEFWPLFINRKEGWVCLGNPTVDDLKW